ncbi:MAG TPA: hypothetical protein VLL08_02975, partial [Kineosporiaceae bacterium]|nr:hypothetical protein [Kineosporiaceae bacterium]
MGAFPGTVADLQQGPGGKVASSAGSAFRRQDRQLCPVLGRIWVRFRARLPIFSRVPAPGSPAPPVGVPAPRSPALPGSGPDLGAFLGTTADLQQGSGGKVASFAGPGFRIQGRQLRRVGIPAP